MTSHDHAHRSVALALALLVSLPAASHAQDDGAPGAGDEVRPEAAESEAATAAAARRAEFRAYRLRLAAEWPGEAKARAKSKASLERAEKLYRVRHGREKSDKAPVGIALKSRMKSVRQIAEAEVESGLAWLALHQEDAGYWSCASFDEQCAKFSKHPGCTGRGSPQFDVGVTSLALLAFLRAGQTPDEGRYAPTVRAGLDYLVAVQGQDGMLGVAEYAQSTYDHIIATLALSEAAGATGSYEYLTAAQKGLDKMFAMRNPGATWRYQSYHPEMILSPNDTSVTGWAVQAMAAARRSNLEVDAAAWSNSMEFILEMTDPISYRTGYYNMGGRPAREMDKVERWPADETESMTAIGLLCRQLIAPLATEGSEPEVRKHQAAIVGSLPPTWDEPGRIDYYFWYQGSQALALYGGDDAYRWADHLVALAFAHATEPDHAAGSWNPAFGPWGSIGGRVYSTAMMTMSMLTVARAD